MSRYSIIVFTLCLPLCASAQQYESSQARESQASPEAVEEVLVIGSRALLQLCMQMMEAEKQTYDIFNKFNDEKRFDISCSMHQPTGTRIERQFCQPGFGIEATKALGQDYLDSLRGFLDPSGIAYTPQVSYEPLEAVIASQQEAYRRKMRQVAEEHPEFLEALIQYSEMWERYEEATSTAGE